MKLHRILKDFRGTQDGLGEGESFMAGTEALLSDYLAEVALQAGYAELAPETDKAPVEARETKVTGPEETKPETTKRKKA